MDTRSLLVGWGLGVISWWAQGEIGKWVTRRKMRTLFQQLERAESDHRAGRRCEIEQCDYCIAKKELERAESDHRAGRRCEIEQCDYCIAKKEIEG